MIYFLPRSLAKPTPSSRSEQKKAFVITCQCLMAESIIISFHSYFFFQIWINRDEGRVGKDSIHLSLSALHHNSHVRKWKFHEFISSRHQKGKRNHGKKLMLVLSWVIYYECQRYSLGSESRPGWCISIKSTFFHSLAEASDEKNKINWNVLTLLAHCKRCHRLSRSVECEAIGELLIIFTPHWRGANWHRETTNSGTSTLLDNNQQKAFTGVTLMSIVSLHHGACQFINNHNFAQSVKLERVRSH